MRGWEHSFLRGVILESRFNLLVVDDSPELRQSIRNQFSEEGFVVDEASDGEAALAMILKTDYDVILLDLRMPRMDGKQVLREMKRHHKTSHVIIVSVTDDALSMDECRRLGAIDYLTKPYEPDELMKVIIQSLSL